jgi:DNA-binding SARP family transcriptional activator
VDVARRSVREAIEMVGTGAQAEFLLAHEVLPLLQRFVKDPVIGGGVRKFLDGFPPALQPLYVRMLGPFEVSRGGAEVAAGAFGRRATRQLFKYLLIHRRHPVTREQAIEALWPKSEPRDAANLLKSRLSLLRRALQPHLGEGQPSAFLLAREGTLQIDPRSPCWIDADEFERLADRGDPDSLAEAIELYRGDLLEEDHYEEWTLPERDRLRDVLLRALASLASSHEAASRPEVAQAFWRRLVELDPCAEHAYQGLIRCALALGRQADALRAFEQCRSRLSEDLGVDPAPQTRALIGGLTSR